MEPKYFYSEANQEALCLRHPSHIENIVLSTQDPKIIKIARHDDKFLYILLQGTFDGLECDKNTYEGFKQKVLQALNLVETEAVPVSALNSRR